MSHVIFIIFSNKTSSLHVNHQNTICHSLTTHPMTPMYQDTVEKLDSVGDQKVDHKMLRYFLQPMDRRYHREKMLELRYEIQLRFEGNGPSILHQKVHLYGAKYLHGANSG